MNEPERWFKGRNLFITIEWISSYVILIVLMVMIMLGLYQFIWVFALILFIFLLGFVAVQQYVYRIHSEKYAGAEILDAWVDIDFDIGEEFLFPIEKIDHFPDISPSARDAVDRFITGMGQYYESITKIDFKKQIEQLDSKIGKSEELQALENKAESSNPKEKKKKKKEKGDEEEIEVS